MMVIVAALNTGKARATTEPVGMRWSQPAADTTMMPMAMSTDASPKLKALISKSPYATRCSAIALKRTTSADGHGTIPPDIPSARIDRAVIGPSGT